MNLLTLSLLKRINSTYFVIVVVAFTQGVINLSDLGINYLYKDDFHLSPAEVSIVAGFTSIPWIIKPLWGAISDGWYFFGYRRKSYLIFFGFLECMCWCALSFWVQQPLEGVVVLFLVQVSVAFCNVIGEALLVEVSRNNAEEESKSEEQKQSEASKNVSLFFSIRSFGVFLTAYTGGLLLHYLNKRIIFLITAIFPTVLAFGSFFLKETSRREKLKEQKINRCKEETSKLLKEGEQAKPTTNDNDGDAKSSMRKVYEFLKQPQILKPILFIFVFMITPSAGSSMFYFYTNELKFAPEFMGQLKLIHAIANMLGIAVYHRFLKLVPFKKLFTISSLICVGTGLTQILLVTRNNVQLGIPDKLFSLTDSLVIQTFAEINTIPLLVLACRLCPKNIEGTMYAMIMSTLNFGNMISFQLGGVAMRFLNITDKNFDNLWMLILLANVTMLLPLPFVYCVDFNVASSHAEQYVAKPIEEITTNCANGEEETEDLINKSFDKIKFH